MNFLTKPKPPPTTADPDKDRLTLSLWPFKIDATGNGVPKAYVLGFTICALWFASLLVYVTKPFPIPSPVAAASKLALK